MSLPWIVTVSSTTVDSILNVRTSVRRQVKQHPNSSWVRPFLIKSIAILVCSNWLLSGRGVTLRGFLHASVADYLLDESLLVQSDPIGGLIPMELDAQEPEDVPIFFQGEVMRMEFLLLLKTSGSRLKSKLFNALGNISKA